MSTLHIQLLFRNSKNISLIYRYLLPDLAPWLTISGSNYPYLEQISMVPKMFVPLKFDCITKKQTRSTVSLSEFRRLLRAHTCSYSKMLINFFMILFCSISANNRHTDGYKLVDLFLSSFEAEFVQSLLKAGKKHLAQQFNFTYRYIDDILSLKKHKICRLFGIHLSMWTWNKGNNGDCSLLLILGLLSLHWQWKACY